MNCQNTHIMMEQDTVDNFFDNHLYRVNKMSLLMIGRWPYQNRKWRVVILSVITSILSSATIGQVLYSIEIVGDIDKMTKFLHAVIVLHCVFVLLINTVVNFDMMQEILENLRDNWRYLKNEVEMAIFLRQTRKGETLIHLYFGGMTTTAISYILQPFTSELFHVLSSTNESHHLKPLLDTQLYIDPHKYYVPIYFHGASVTVAVFIIIFALDAYFMMIVYHACAMYNILGHRIHMIGEDYTNACMDLTIDDQEKFILRRIVECTKYHRECIRFSESIEKSSNVSWLLMITPMIFIISVTAVRAILTVNEIEQSVTFAVCSACAVLRVFNISLVGQELLDHSVQIHQLIYSMPWYELPPKAKKLLIPMLLRASKPSNITSGKLMPLNLSGFCSLANVSMSYIAFILSITD